MSRQSDSPTPGAPSATTSEVRNDGSRSKLLKFAGLGGSAAGATTTATTVLKQPHRTHSRALSQPNTPPPAPAQPITTSSKSTTSKSKDMHHRLGTMPTHTPLVGTLAPAITAAASVSSVSLVSSAAQIGNGSSSSDPWHMLHVNVLPLFNDEQLRLPIEVLNQLVRKRIAAMISTSPPRAVSKLEQDLCALLSRGMITLNVNLSDLEDTKLLARLAEVWRLFWHQVLPYVEGIFLPLETDEPIKALSRTPRTQRPSSPTSTDAPPPSAQPHHINVHALALRSFLNAVVLPIAPRLQTQISKKDKDVPVEGEPSPEELDRATLQQMLLILASMTKTSTALSTDAQAASREQSVVRDLLRALRNPTRPPSAPYHPRHASLFIGSGPRDRRGRVPRRVQRTSSGLNGAMPEEPEQSTSPTAADPPPRYASMHRTSSDRLRALRADSDMSVSTTVAESWDPGSAGRVTTEEDEDWDKAQEVLERMVGLRAGK